MNILLAGCGWSDCSTFFDRHYDGSSLLASIRGYVRPSKSDLVVLLENVMSDEHAQRAVHSQDFSYSAVRAPCDLKYLTFTDIVLLLLRPTQEQNSFAHRLTVVLTSEQAFSSELLNRSLQSLKGHCALLMHSGSTVGFATAVAKELFNSLWKSPVDSNLDTFTWLKTVTGFEPQVITLPSSDTTLACTNLPSEICMPVVIDSSYLEKESRPAESPKSVRPSTRNPHTNGCREVVLCIDFEGCVVRDRGTAWEAVSDNIEAIRQLGNMNCRIKILTTKGAHQKPEILKFLQSVSLDEAELVFEKPSATSYVQRDTFRPEQMKSAVKELVFGAQTARADVDNLGAMEFLPSRPCNTVTLAENDMVLKSSSSPAIRGEIFFYTHMPKDIKHLFPSLQFVRMENEQGYRIFSAAHGVENQIVQCDATNCSTGLHCSICEWLNRGSTFSFQTPKVSGPTMSHLLLARCVTADTLTAYTRNLQHMHASYGSNKCVSTCEQSRSSRSTTRYDNYQQKIRERMEKFSWIYRANPAFDDSLYRSLIALLDSYERQDRGQSAHVVHGDPVFSNVLLCRDGAMKFIDMRGMQGQDSLALEGDVVYDLAKCLQSLSGYEHICFGDGLRDDDASYLTHLQEQFRGHVAQSYPSVRYRDIALASAGLYFSLIPFHACRERQRLFLNLSQMILQVVMESFDRNEMDLQQGVYFLPRTSHRQ